VTNQYAKPVIIENTRAAANKSSSKDTSVSRDVAGVAATGEAATGAVISYLASMKQFVTDIPKPKIERNALGTAAVAGLAIAGIVYLAVSISRSLELPRCAEQLQTLTNY
jgi:hypothetical protein